MSPVQRKVQKPAGPSAESRKRVRNGFLQAAPRKSLDLGSDQELRRILDDLSDRTKVAISPVGSSSSAREDGLPGVLEVTVKAKGLEQLSSEKVADAFVHSLEQLARDWQITVRLTVKNQQYAVHAGMTARDLIRMAGRLQGQAASARRLAPSEAVPRERLDAGMANLPMWLHRTQSGQWVFNTDRAMLVWCMLRDYIDGFSFEQIAENMAEQGLIDADFGGQPVKSAIFTPALIGLWGGRRLDRELPFAEHRPERPALLELRTYWHVRDIHEVQRARQSEQLLMSDVLYCERTGERMRAKFDRRVGKMALLCAKGCEHAPLTLEDASQLEDGLFDWLRQRGDFVNELRNPLDVDDEELRKIIKAFQWNSKAPRSLESEVRQRLGFDQTSLSLDPSTALDQAVDMMRASLVARSQRERQRAARMRQRLGQILRKRIAKVFVGTSQAAARPPEQRSYVALRFSASSAVDGVAAATRRAESAPAIRIRLQAIETSETAHVFDVPSRPQSGNTNQFLDGQHREITMTEAPCGQNTPGVRPTFSKTLGAIKGWEDVFAKVPMPGDAQPCTPMEPWFHYVSKSHGADWGIHVCACGLDSAAIALWTRLGRATCDWPVATQMAMGMPLAFTRFFARFDLWIESTTDASRDDPYTRVAEHTLEESPEKDRAGLGLSLQLSMVRRKPSVLLDFKRASNVLKAVRKERRKWLVSILAAGQVPSWASTRDSAIELQVERELSLMEAPFNLGGLAQHDDAWKILAKRIRKAKGSRVGPLIPTVRSALHMPSTSAVDDSSTPIHVYGRGALADTLSKLSPS